MSTLSSVNLLRRLQLCHTKPKAARRAADEPAKFGWELVESESSEEVTALVSLFDRVSAELILTKHLCQRSIGDVMSNFQSL